MIIILDYSFCFRSTWLKHAFVSKCFKVVHTFLLLIQRDSVMGPQVLVCSAI